MVRAPGCRGRECERWGSVSPWDPPVVTNRPHSCSGRSPVANRLGSFPRKRLLCLSTRRRGVLRTAAFVAWVGESFTQAMGREGHPGVVHPADPTGASMCPPHRHQVPPSQGPTCFLGSVPPPSQLPPCVAKEQEEAVAGVKSAFT